MRQIRVNEMGAMPDPQKPQGVAAEQQPKKVEIQMTQPEQTAPDKDLSATEALGFYTKDCSNLKQTKSENIDNRPVHKMEDFKSDKDGKSYLPCELKKGESIYSMVQREYGLSDPKHTMQVVREVKEYNNIPLKTLGIPKVVNLPNWIPNEKYGDVTLRVETGAEASAVAAAGPGQIIMGSGLRNVGVGFEAALRNLFPILNTSAEAVKDTRKPDAEAQPKSEAETPKED